jgi:hypothetical protein
MARLKTTGALLVRPNPKKRRSRRRRNPVLTRLSNPKRRHNRKHVMKRANRKVARKSFAKLISALRKRNPLAIRANARRRRNPLFMRSNPLFVRSNPLFMRKNGMKKRHNRAKRHNPAFAGLFTKVATMVKGLPVVGPFLASAISMGGTAVLGAVAVEPTLMLAKFVGPYFPSVSTTVFYPLVALGLAAAVKNYLSGVLGDKMADDFALAIASAGAAVAYYKFRTGSDSDVQSEAAGLEVAAPLAGIADLAGGMAGFAGGEAYRVVPFQQQYAGLSSAQGLGDPTRFISTPVAVVGR